MSHPYNEIDQKESDRTQSVQNQRSAKEQSKPEQLEINSFLEQTPIKTTTLVSIGFIIWLLATLALRFFGQYIFKPNEPILALAVYLVTAFAVVALAQLIFSWQKLDHSQQFQAVVLLALPGMLLDSIVMVSFTKIFPNLSASSDSAVGSWLLWAYAIVLVAAFIRKSDL